MYLQVSAYSLTVYTPKNALDMETNVFSSRATPQERCKSKL
jgi:hypothetical protein